MHNVYITLNIESADGLQKIIISHDTAIKSGVIKNIMYDTVYTGLATQCSATGVTQIEVSEIIIPIPIGFNHLTLAEIKIFIDCWTHYYDYIPDNLEYSSVHYSLNLPTKLITLFKPDNTYINFLNEKDIYTVCTGIESLSPNVNSSATCVTHESHTRLSLRDKMRLEFNIRDSKIAIKDAPLFTYDIRLISKFVEPANFLDLPKMINLFILIIAKQYRFIIDNENRDCGAF